MDKLMLSQVAFVFIYSDILNMLNQLMLYSSNVVKITWFR